MGNSRILETRSWKVRPKIRIAVDTTVYQLCAAETVQVWADLKGTIGPPSPYKLHYDAVLKEFPEALSEQLPWLNAILEAARADSLELVLLPTIAKELSGAKVHGRYHGIERLDFGVRYSHMSLHCPKLTATHGLPQLQKHPNCQLEVGHYLPLAKHATGRKQHADCWHLALANSVGIDVFLTTDFKFIAAYRDIEHRLNKQACRTAVLSPKEFCQRIGMFKIPLVPPHPRQTRGVEVIR